MKVLHCTDKKNIDRIKKEGLEIPPCAGKEGLVNILFDMMAENMGISARRINAIHAMSPYWEDAHVAFCKTRDFDGVDDAVIVYDAEDSSLVCDGEPIMNCEIIINKDKQVISNCLKEARNYWEKGIPLKDIYKQSDVEGKEILVPGPIAPEKLRVYNSLAEALKNLIGGNHGTDDL